jgi:hypothetical protein
MPAETFLAWNDPTTPWMAKLDWAGKHLTAFREQVSGYESRSYDVVQEVSGDRLTITLRLRLHEQIPLHFALIIGDVVHNLRSSLDTLAYEFARRHVGGDLPARLERQPAFPICSSTSDYDKFFAKRRTVFGAREEKALRSVAPGSKYHSIEIEGEPPWTFDDSAKQDQLWKLNHLWNIDKHRHLHLAVWWPDHTLWASGEAPSHDWRPGIPPFVDGSIVGQLIAATPDTPPPFHIASEFALRLTEAGAAGESMLGVLTRFHEYLRTWVVPAAWQAYDAVAEDDSQAGPPTG